VLFQEILHLEIILLHVLISLLTVLIPSQLRLVFQLVLGQNDNVKKIPNSTKTTIMSIILELLLLYIVVEVSA
jgi:hypothetical protein